MASQPRTCGNGDCNLATDEKCVEGYPLEECPHVGRISIEDIQEVRDDAEPTVIAETTIQLDSGEPLDRETAASLQRRRLSRAIGLIGPNDSGKTSLIASLYDLFQSGPVSGVSFAGSNTLIGFEKVCHLARAVSRRVKPHTQRTSVGADATFFHLDLHQEGTARERTIWQRPTSLRGPTSSLNFAEPTASRCSSMASSWPTVRSGTT